MSKSNGLLSPTLFNTIVNECEHKGLAIWNEEFSIEKTEAIQLGAYVDALSQNKEKSFIENNPDILTIREKKLKAKFQKAYEDYTDVMKRDKFFASFLDGEMQKELVGEIGGLKFHGYPDFITDDKIVDLKYVNNIDFVKGIPFVIARHYHWQLYFYNKLAGGNRECYLAVITKEEPYNHEIISISDSLLAQAEEEILKSIPRVNALLNGEVEPIKCGSCDYCRKTKVITEPIDAELVGINGNELIEIERRTTWQ